MYFHKPLWLFQLGGLARASFYSILSQDKPLVVSNLSSDYGTFATRVSHGLPPSSHTLHRNLTCPFPAPQHGHLRRRGSFLFTASVDSPPPEGAAILPSAAASRRKAGLRLCPHINSAAPFRRVSAGSHAIGRQLPDQAVGPVFQYASVVRLLINSEIAVVGTYHLSCLQHLVAQQQVRCYASR